MFKFRLERVLQWKEQREQARASELAQAQGGQAAALQRVSELEGVREAGVQSATRIQGARPTVGQLQNLRLLVDHLTDALEQAQEEAEEADEKVRLSMAHYTAAFQERKVLDRLREKSHESWAMEQAEADRLLMDSIALSGFVQRRAAQAEGEG